MHMMSRLGALALALFGGLLVVALD